MVLETPFHKNFGHTQEWVHGSLTMKMHPMCIIK